VLIYSIQQPRFWTRAQGGYRAGEGKLRQQLLDVRLSTAKDVKRSHFLDLARPALGEEEITDAVDTLRSGWLVSGPKVSAFEAALEERLAPARVRCLSSATAGLLLGLRLADVGPGDEVILPTLTFAGCSNCVELFGATPIFVDSEPLTGLLDVRAVEARIGPRTKAILAVHLGGRPVDIDRLNGLRDAYDVAVVEDAAHAIGAEWRRRPLGSHGNVTAFSFHASKNITTIEGGAVALPDPDQARRIERLRLQGLSRSSWNRHGSSGPADYDLEEPGYKLAMTDVAAAIGIHQLAKLDGFIARREELARRYDELLEHLPLELEPPPPEGARHARHLYTVRIAPDAGIPRDEVVIRLSERRIGTSIHFKPIHRLRYYRERLGLTDALFPVACDYADRTLSLPLHPLMDEEDVADVAAALTGALHD
jgi:dTDP-4-amino-4,6-dideoxygalactose transaminase